MSMGEWLDFLIYFIDQQNEELLWEVWLHKPIESSFDEWKKSIKQNANKRRMTAEEEDTNLRRAEEILNMGQFQELELVRK